MKISLWNQSNDPSSDSYVKNEELVLHLQGYQPLWKPPVWTAKYEQWSYKTSGERDRDVTRRSLKACFDVGDCDDNNSNNNNNNEGNLFFVRKPVFNKIPKTQFIYKNLIMFTSSLSW